jgi:hypothetical protein
MPSSESLRRVNHSETAAGEALVDEMEDDKEDEDRGC